MYDWINIGPTPTEETCAQVGSKNYSIRARRECKAFRNQLSRLLDKQFPDAKIHCKLRITSNPHDFGTYLDLDAGFSNDEEQNQAYWLESNTPTHWDEEAQQGLS